MDVEAVQAAGAEGDGLLPQRQGPHHPGDEDLPLSRPLHVRSRQIPHPRGSDRSAREARSHRAFRPEAGRSTAWSARTISRCSTRTSAPSSHRRRNSPPKAPSPARLNFTRMCSPDVHANSDARAVAHHGRGQARQWLVKEGDTVKSGDILAEIETDKATMEFEAVDEGTYRKDPGARRQRRRESQFAHRHLAGRWRGCVCCRASAQEG